MPPLEECQVGGSEQGDLDRVAEAVDVLRLLGEGLGESHGSKANRPRAPKR